MRLQLVSMRNVNEVALYEIYRTTTVCVLVAKEAFIERMGKRGNMVAMSLRENFGPTYHKKWIKAGRCSN
jgi:hypothetical protein